jgi:Domain of unknown function (DUF6475)
MIESDKPEFFKLITDVHKFYRQETSAFSLQVWWTTMQQFDFVAVREAMGRHAMNPDSGQFLPKPADVVKMLAGSTQDAALIAWTKVDRAIRLVGTYQSVCFDDPLINAVVSEMGGWIELGKVKEDEWPFRRNEFVNRYRGYRMRSATPQYPAHLLGIAEAANAQTGKAIAPPIMVGDQERALKVLLGGSEMPVLTFKPMAKFLEGFAA